ncbi:hypothetical protein BsWGS_11581 [Bradybaena similaris]
MPVKIGGVGVNIEYTNNIMDAEKISTGKYCINYDAEVQTIKMAANKLLNNTLGPQLAVFLTFFFFFSNQFPMLSCLNRKMGCPHVSNRQPKVISGSPQLLFQCRLSWPGLGSQVIKEGNRFKIGTPGPTVQKINRATKSVS